MAITNYLVHFKTKANYETTTASNPLRNDAVAFIKDATIIRTHGTDYYCGSGPVALQSDLSGYATTSALTSGLAGKANTSHTHTIANITNLQTALDGKAATSHNHTSANVTALTGYIEGSSTTTLTATMSLNTALASLQNQIQGKAASSHTHTIAQVSGLQAELNSKLESVSLADLGITATAAELNKLDGCTATVTELNYVDGVTSNIQTQLNGKQASITGGASTITSSNLTASRALVSNSSGKVTVSTITSTELGYLDGVTSNIQTQLNNKLSSAALDDYLPLNTQGNYYFANSTFYNIALIERSTGIAINAFDSSSDSNYGNGLDINQEGFQFCINKNTGDNFCGMRILQNGGIVPRIEIVSDGATDISFHAGQGSFSDRVTAVNGFYETSDARLKNFYEDVKALEIVSEIPTKYFT